MTIKFLCSRVINFIFITLAFSAVCLSNEIFFSPKGGASEEIVAHINSSQREINIAIYSFTSKSISEALVKAYKRGVKVYIVMDAEQATNKNAQDEFLEGNGISLRRISGIGRGIMHDKFAIFDGKSVITGSYNWTNNAEEYNHENAIFLDDKSTIDTFSKEFENLWHQPVKTLKSKKDKKRKMDFPNFKF